MRCLTNMDRIQMNNSLMIQLLNFYEDKGRSYYYKEVFERDDQIMARQTLEEDILSFSKYLNLDITPSRMQLLANSKKSYVPRKKDEKLMINIKSVFNKIQALGNTFILNVNEAYDLVSILFRGYENVGYKIRNKTSKSIIKEFNNKNSREQLEELVYLYHKARKSKRYELLTLIANFYVDFVKIQPFTKYNETIGLLLVYTMVAKEFQVCRYHSFFNEFLKFKERFNLSLAQSFYDWEHGLSQTEPLVRVFLDTIVNMNDVVRQKEHMYTFEVTLNKTNNVERVIYELPSIFKKQDIREQLPLVSDGTINRTLQILREKNIIISLGKGRSAQWQRIKDRTDKFNPEQLTLF